MIMAIYYLANISLQISKIISILKLLVGILGLIVHGRKKSSMWKIEMVSSFDKASVDIILRNMNLQTTRNYDLS